MSPQFEYFSEIINSTSFLTLAKLDIRTASKDLDFMVNLNRCQLNFSDQNEQTEKIKVGVRTGYLQSFLGQYWPNTIG